MPVGARRGRGFRRPRVRPVCRDAGGVAVSCQWDRERISGRRLDPADPAAQARRKGRMSVRPIGNGLQETQRRFGRTRQDPCG